MTDDRQAGLLREARAWVAEHAMRWDKYPSGTTVVDAEELDAWLAALAVAQVPAQEHEPWCYRRHTGDCVDGPEVSS